MAQIVKSAKITWRRSPRGMGKAFQDSRHRANRAIGLHWLAVMYDRHFAPNANNVYKYKSRSYGYKKRKLREKGHNIPLVWSGAAKRALKAAVVKASERRVTVQLGVGAPPRMHQYMRARGKYGKGPYKWGELKTINKDETPELAKAGKAEFRQALKAAKT
jgi:hypothetical protein